MISPAPPTMPLLRGPVPLSHLMLGSLISPGSSLVDATCGNGQDTLLLARLAGPRGRVWAFDIQQDALDVTAQTLAAAGLSDRVQLINKGHEHLAAQISVPLHAAVFNLGYRPGGDRSIITRPATTLAGLEQALQLLLPGGILAVTIYPGHCGGDLEARAVEEWSAGLKPGSCQVWHMRQAQVPPNAPYFMLIQKGA